jgi:hypothetical protein
MTVPDALLHALRTRLLARPRPGSWLGPVIRAFPAADDASAGPVHWPPAEPVHLVSPDRVDAARVGERVLVVDRHLQPWQRDGLQAFVAAQRHAQREPIRARCTDREAGFERLMRGLPGRPDDCGG